MLHSAGMPEVERWLNSNPATRALMAQVHRGKWRMILTDASAQLRGEQPLMVSGTFEECIAEIARQLHPGALQ